ncbi:MAG TPA: PAS domain S-box protein [Candidatus Sulfotelmatobacter sp.]|nr:PAS domain S-box protein [Candidatus Sulfotelmatobacter sp.]
MSSADRTRLFCASAGFLRSRVRFYGFALIAVCAASALQRVLETTIAFPHSFLLFYPTILIVALLAGFWPGVVATALCGLGAAYFDMHAAGSSTVSDETRPVGLALLGVIGIAISWLASSLRQRANRLQEFERVVESLEEMIVVIDRNYRYQIANRAFLQYRGMKKEDVIGRHVVDVLDPAVFENKFKRNLDKCFQGETVSFEMMYRYPELGERQLLVEYLPIQGSGGIDRVACVLHDLTEQKKAEDALRESEDRYRDLVEHGEDLICTHDLKGRLLSVNPAAGSSLGYEIDELLGIPCFRHCHRAIVRRSKKSSWHYGGVYGHCTTARHG